MKEYKIEISDDIKEQSGGKNIYTLQQNLIKFIEDNLKENDCNKIITNGNIAVTIQ